MVFNPLINERCSTMIKLVQKQIQNTILIYVMQEFWDEFTNRCKTGLSTRHQAIALYYKQLICISMNKNHLHYQFSKLSGL